MSHYHEKPMSPEVQAELAEWISHGYSVLGLSNDSPPDEAIRTVGRLIDSWRIEHQNSIEDPEVINEQSLTLGAAWGTAVIKEFGWQWTCVEYEGQDFFAVVAPDRAYGCLPFNNIYTLLTDSQADNCAILLFNMIKAGNLPPSDANRYQMLGFGARYPNLEI